MSWEIKVGDALEVLRTMPSESVHCVVTSPPYWGLRDYGVEGQLGLERTPEEYIANMLAVFREVRRVLRSDGTLWLNIGDSYAGGGNYRGLSSENTLSAKQSSNRGARGLSQQLGAAGKECGDAKPKDLCGIPWMLAFALRADGWWLRQDIIWSKPNPMPESVTDRCTKAHEYLFLLTKSARYFYDAEAVKERALDPEDDLRRISKATLDGKSAPTMERNGIRRDGINRGDDERGRKLKCADPLQSFRNKRSVWEIATSPFPEAHFATYPPKLVEPCILAGTSERGCCAACGAPWERMVDRPVPPPEVYADRAPKDELIYSGTRVDGEWKGMGQKLQDWRSENPSRTVGWQAGCECGAETAPCTVIDPFAGAGTTGLVATRLGRSFIGIELNADYAAMARRRITADAPLFNTEVKA